MASQAIRGAVRGVHYSASKGGVVAMTRATALELAPHGIGVNGIAPGLTDTAQPRYGNNEEELAAMASAVPLGRMAQPDDIAAVAVFLASDDARHITGQTVHVNGGSYLPWAARGWCGKGFGILGPIDRGGAKPMSQTPSFFQTV